VDTQTDRRTRHCPLPTRSVGCSLDVGNVHRPRSRVTDAVVIIVGIAAFILALYAMTLPPKPSEAAALPDGTWVAPQGAHPAYIYLAIPSPAALLTLEGGVVRNRPLPPGSVIGFPRKYLEDQADQLPDVIGVVPDDGQ
jgi:hypothetical protein